MQFIDLQAQRRRIEPEINAAVKKVIEEGRYVMGPEVAEFEKALASYGDAKRTVGVANGTDALVLPLMAWGVKPGDAVFCPSFTFAATAQIIPWLGATPVFVDVETDTYNMSPVHLDAAIEMIKADGKLNPKAVIAVDLFGQPANYPEISAIVKKHGLKLISDS
ncbi:MAG: DegT/DnrJ/EryC1/StrS aminotransferase family protein, partial [Hyphomonadaceae bacterium]